MAAWRRPEIQRKSALLVLASGALVAIALVVLGALGVASTHAGVECLPDGPPAIVTAPTVTPIGAIVGTTLTTSNGTWQNTVCNPAPTSFSYQWKRNGTVISGATSSTYVTQSADANVDGTISDRSTVTGCNANGCLAVDSSNSVTPTITVLPASGVTVDTVTPVLTVSPNPVQLKYEFQLSKTSAFTSIVLDSGWLTTSIYGVPAGALEDETNYYWRIRVSNPGLTQTSGWTPNSNYFHVSLPKLGARDYWPIWSHGPLAVNEVNGNLVLSLPTPSYPTATGSLGFSLTYNSQEPADHGLGAGWTLFTG
jgi:hypothetical protein